MESEAIGSTSVCPKFSENIRFLFLSLIPHDFR